LAHKAGRADSVKAARRVVAASLVLVAAGCMTGAQTFEQALAYQRWKRCDTFATVTLQRIDTDGRVVVLSRTPDQYPFLRCMADQAREQQKSKPDLVVPEPTVNLRPN
jgi:hypothetical protein